MKQETFMMLKPDAFETHHEDDVVALLRSQGLSIISNPTVLVTMDIMKVLLEHYQGVIDDMPKDFNFPGKLFNSFYYDGPHYIMPMRITYDGEDDIITLTRTLIGKTNPADADTDTIRGMYSDDDYEKAGKAVRLVKNVIHASDSHESALRELAIWEQYLK